MDYKKIIEEGRLVYSSHPLDLKFREWRLVRTMCKVVYYSTHPLSKLDKVILLTLNTNGILYENQLAKILGFNVEDDFNAYPKRYADKGENDIFLGMLSEVASYGLINRKDNQVCLSNIGKLALKKGMKFSFYNGALALMESFDIAQKQSADYKMFPFRDALGIISSIQGIKTIGYERFETPDIENIIYGIPSELVSRLMLQCNNNIHIFEAEETTESRMGEIYVDFKLYSISDKKYPLIFYKDEISLKANELLLQSCNTDYVNSKIHLGEYLYLIKESGYVLNYYSMIPYKDVWNLDDFLDSNYLEWGDKVFFEEIAKSANGSQWNKISALCPTNDLIPHLDKYKDSFDWIVLSSRYDDDFIVNNAISYPWDFETLSHERSANFIKRIIVIPELHKDVDWDWENVLSKLDDKFVIDNIANIPFNMYSVSRKYLNIYRDIINRYPERRWNWQIISSEADLLYILNNLSIFSAYLHFDIVMSRVFMSEEHAEAFCDSSEFAFAVIQKKELLQSRYNANQSEYPWTIKMIDWHEQLGFITWKSENGVQGLECNRNIVWDTNLFEHYKDKTFSIYGLNNISESITDNSIIDRNPDFKWIWSILSKRDIVISDLNFIERHIENLSLSISIPLIAPDFLTSLYEKEKFKQQVTEQKVWDKLTNCIEKTTILKNITDNNWDWNVITQNFCSTLNFVALDKLNVLDKLNWDYISKHAEIEKIKHNIADYSDKWKWSTLTKRLDHDFIIDNLPEYYLYWEWSYIITEVFTDDDLADEKLRIQIPIIFSQLEDDILRKDLWEKITSRFSTEDILKINLSNSQLVDVTVQYEWNYNDVYNRKDFDINKLLTEYKKTAFPIDWDALSSSKALNNILSWDKKIIKDFSVWEEVVLNLLKEETFHWNFKYLSTLSSINWCDSILKTREQDWDWSFLSENSKCFSFNSKRPNDLVRHIHKFANYLDFGILSKRHDMKMTLDMMSLLIEYDWDWNVISSNKSFSLSADFVGEHKKWDWDWKELCSRKDCEFTSEFILNNKELNWDWAFLSKRKDIRFSAEDIVNLIDKNWDWKELLKRKDLQFSEEMLPQIANVDIDWKAFCQRNDFFPTMRALSILKNKELDWDEISKRMELPYDVIVHYKDKLNWSILTNSPHIDLGNSKIIETFKDYLDWGKVSNSPNFILSFENLQRFKDKISWSIICKRQDLVIDEGFLNAFEDKVDWKRISQSGTINFTKDLVDRYKDRWDWVVLAQNPAFRTSGIETFYKVELNLTGFYNNLKSNQYGRPFIYHFTHMFNAIEVIKSRKILSRDRAKELGLLKYDAAGSVVHRSAKAHPFARFYYRTGTPTQFYNECLGKSKGTEHYNKAEENGLPMCPMPVFFKFDLQEVLAKFPNLCYYSTGNMQSNWARVFKIMDDPDNIDCVNLYSYKNDKVVRDKKQQEFLVKNEFDFSELKDYQIICYDHEETEILKRIFKNDPICEHIFCVNDAEKVFEKINPNLRFDFSDNRIEIRTDYNGEYIFQIECDQINKIKINNPKSIKSIKGHIIQLNGYVSIECGNVPFDIYYVNMSPYARSPRWLVYQYTPTEREIRVTESDIIEKFLGVSFDDDLYSPKELITSLELTMPRLEELYNTRVRHYVVKKHTLLVCEQFEKFAFDFNTDYMNIDMMRIILALHDVGKAIDRANQHTHTLSLIREFWETTPFTDYELKLAEIILKNDYIGAYFQNKYLLSDLKQEIIDDAKKMDLPPVVLLQYKMILYQCDIASYTKDAGGLRYLESMFIYKEGEKVFDDKEGIIAMSSEYAERYNTLKSEIYG